MEDAEDSISAETSIEENSYWFSGHFPGDPILPGIAQILLVNDMIKSVNDTLSLASVKRVKFRRLVRPNEKLRVHAKKSGGTNYFFTLYSGDELVSSGIFQVE